MVHCTNQFKMNCKETGIIRCAEQFEEIYHWEAVAVTFYFAAVFRAGSHDIDASGINRTVSQNVGKLGNILLSF